MSHSLLLLLKGPMQSWGDSSRFSDRHTGPVPTKSGVLGLVAAADGRRRTDPLEDLAGLRFAVRVDQPGTLLRDYQTAASWQGAGHTRLVTRYYLADAAFVAAVESEDRALLEGLEEALRFPRFPLYLGRRSCPANHDLVLGIRDCDAVSALNTEPWHASASHKRTRPTEVFLPIHRDALPGEVGEHKRDVPVSFDQANRDYSWRVVVADQTREPITNTLGTDNGDPFFEAVITA